MSGRRNGRARVGGKEGEDATAEFFGLVAESGSVKSAGDDPQLFGATSGGVNHFGVTAGKGFVLFVADEENRKGARGNRLHGGDIRDGKTGEFFSAIEQRPTERRE